MTPLTTTLNRICEHAPCADGWAKLLNYLGKTEADDEPLPYATIVESNGLPDALWCCRAEPQYNREWRLFAVWCARQVQHLITSPHLIAVIDVAERYANGEAAIEELRNALGTIGDASWVVGWFNIEDARRDAAWAYAWAIRTAPGMDTWDAQKAQFLKIVGEKEPIIFS